MNHDSEPKISLASLMSAEGGDTEDMSSVSPPSALDAPQITQATRHLKELSPSTQERVREATALGESITFAQLVDLHQELLDTTLDQDFHHNAFQHLYTIAPHQLLIQMWRQIDARDIPRRHILLPLIVARAIRANELEQIAALQAGLRLAHPAICQVATLMFARSSYKVRIASVKAMEELGARPEHYFLTQHLIQKPDVENALIIAIKRALQAIDTRHPVGAANAGGELSLSSVASSGALSLLGSAHDPQHDEALDTHITRLLDEGDFELVELPQHKLPVVAPHSSGFIGLKSDEQRRVKIIDTVLFNEYTAWKTSLVLMCITLLIQVGIAIIYQPFAALAFIGLLPLMYDKKLNHADALRQIVFGDRIARAPLAIPTEGSGMASAELMDEESGESHKRYFKLSSTLKKELLTSPSKEVSIAWHPDVEDAYIVESHNYLKLNEQGSLARSGGSKSPYLLGFVLLHIVTYAGCMLLLAPSFESITSVLQTEAYGIAFLVCANFAIKYNAKVNTGYSM